MQSRRRILRSSQFVAVLILIMAFYALVGAFSPATELTVRASVEQQQAFSSLVRTNERIFFDAWLTGDLSRFLEVYVNDPEYPPNTRDRGLILLEQTGHAGASDSPVSICYYAANMGREPDRERMTI